MQRGLIVEQGRHTELLQADGIYAKLHHKGEPAV
jgi:ABC-type transport system involved in Fe-S cluster assembly fused permease/ATPase subunit